MMMSLPDATQQNPACGCCGGETSYDGDSFTCEDCLLTFDSYTFEASFRDPEAKPCGAVCENFWHGDNKIRPGLGFDCGTCKLPAGHVSFHWNGCQSKSARRGA